MPLRETEEWGAIQKDPEWSVINLKGDRLAPEAGAIGKPGAPLVHVATRRINGACVPGALRL
jgi:hypothetical protein